ncbi:MAG: type II toxin-antitoxin system PemK/MazF family toxin [Dehalococcoidia bacterium]
MNRGELYRVRYPRGDPKTNRVFVIVSRQGLLDTRYRTAICAPVYSSASGLATQVLVGPDQGLKHDSAIHCDALVSLNKSTLTDYVGRLTDEQVVQVSRALKIALDLR